jgi:hypothetical protein
VGAVHLHAPPYYENVRALVRKSVAEQSAVFLPWGDGSATISLVGGEDVSRVAAMLLADSKTPSVSSYDLIAATPTVKEIVETLSAVLQRPIRYVGITDEQWADAIRGHINPHALDHLSHLWRYFRSTERRAKRLAALPIQFSPSREAARRLLRIFSEPTRQSSEVLRLQPESASGRVHPRRLRSWDCCWRHNENVGISEAMVDGLVPI